MKAKLHKHLERLKRMPKWQRVGIGMLLVTGGILGALPILGFWMIPLGLAVLAVDYAWAGRINARLRRAVSAIRDWWRDFRKS